ncbi:MAG: Mu-like prophage major head subunit gpT family protein [Planctomycetota bacterium]
MSKATLEARFKTTAQVAKLSEGNGRREFDLVAYSGGPMRPTLKPPLPHPVVIKLSGLDLDKQNRPVLRDHDLGRLLGHTNTITTDGRELRASGAFSGEQREIEPVLEANDAGFAWQVSVGVSFDLSDMNLVAAGQRRQVNGREVNGPVFVINRSKLREISILTLGADDDTSAEVSATLNPTNMPETNQHTADDAPAIDGVLRSTLNTDADAFSDEPVLGRVGDVYDVEARRVAKIRAIAEDHPSILRAALVEDWDLEKVQDKVDLAKLYANQPQAPRGFDAGTGIAFAGSGRNGRALTAGQDVTATLAAALLCRGGKEEIAAKTYGERAVAMAAGLSTLPDMARHAVLSAGGSPAGMDSMTLAASGLSTMSLPNALSDAANKLIIEGYQDTPSTWQAWCRERNTSDFKEHLAIRGLDVGELTKIGKGGEVKHMGVGEQRFPYRVETYAGQIALSRQDVINDDAGIFLDMAREFGNRAMRKMSDVAYETLFNAIDGGSHFAAANGNVLNSSSTNGSQLNADTLRDAIVLLHTQRDDENNDLDFSPTTLLVPPELHHEAKALLESDALQRIETGDRLPTGNPNRNAVRLAVEPRLSNTGKYSSASGTHWLLFAAASAQPFISSFLNGRSTPTINYYDVESDPDTLGVRWRIYHDFGFALGEPKAAVYATGEAAA